MTGIDTDTTGTLGAYLTEVASESKTLSDSPQGDSMGDTDSVDIASVHTEARQQQWLRLMAKLRSMYGEDYYQRHLVPLQLGADQVSGDSITVVLSGATSTSAQTAQLQKRLLPLWVSEDSAVEAIHVTSSDGMAISQKANPIEHHQRLDKRLRFERFIAAEPNEFAYAAARRVAESPQAQYNPLFLFGGVGLGKTHLMTAIALYRQQHFPEQKVLYLTAESFMRRFVQALRSREIMQFKQEFRKVDMLLIDDIHFIANKTSTQDEFFHTLNDLIEAGKSVVVASDRSPHEITDIESRIRSRLGAGLVAEISAPDVALRTLFLTAQAERAGSVIPEEVIDFLAQNLPISIRELEGAMNRLIAHQDLINRPMGLDMCRKILRDVLHQPRLRITVDTIQRTVASYYRIKPEDMSSGLRARRVARPRQVAMYLCKRLTSRSLPEIGRLFGGRDHTTVMHALKKISALCAESEDWAEDIRRISEDLQQ